MICRSPVKDERVLAIYRGIGTHAPEWDDFETFKAWAFSHGYQENLTIDRIDNDGGYWPDNCRWLDMHDQSRNKTNNRIVTVAGKEYILADAAQLNGLTPTTVAKRLDAGWPPEEAVRKMLNRESRKLYVKYSKAA